jgi:hypothetical protein
VTRFHFLFALLVSFVCMACQKQAVHSNMLFNVDSLLANQAELLQHKNAMLSKHVVMNGKESETRIQTLDSLAWRKELRLFETIHVVNKSVNKEAYTIVDRIANVNSNLLTKSISTDRPLAVRLLQLHYLKSPDHLRNVSVEIEHRNWMYTNKNTLDLHFQDIGQDIVLVGYRIQGHQKVMFRDSVNFDIRAMISLPQ